MIKPLNFEMSAILDHRNLENVSAVILDVDGVLTDGTLFMLAPGEWRRSFHIQDGYGLKQLIRSGVHVALVTGSQADDIEARASQLGIPSVYQGVENKLPVVEDLLRRLNIPLKNTMYVGDDLPDLPVLEQVGFPVTVPNAHPEILALPNVHITQRSGGFGAVREVADMIVQAKSRTKEGTSNAVFSTTR